MTTLQVDASSTSNGDNIRIAAHHALRRQDSERPSNVFRAACFPVIWDLRYETLDWALDATELPDATAHTLGAASIFAGMVGRVDDRSPARPKTAAIPLPPLEKIRPPCSWTTSSAACRGAPTPPSSPQDSPPTGVSSSRGQ